MKAVVYGDYGSPEQLVLRDVEQPLPKDGEVLVKVHAVAINDWDWGLLLGDSFVNRLLFGLLKPKRTILGSDVAGRVEAVGRKVVRFRVGDAVFGDLSGRWGGFAESVCAPETSLALIPAGMTFAEAASIPQAGMLAVQGLRIGGGVKPGQRLLINGAGGGVGTFALQLAKPHGVELTGVDSSEKLDFMRGLGFDHVIDYRLEDFARGGPRYDLILDAKSTRSPFACARALNPGGTYVTVGGSMSRLLQILCFGPLISWMQGKRLRVVALKPNADLDHMSARFEAGEIRPKIQAFEGLEGIREAMRHYGTGQHQGKVVITLMSEA
ncbi:MAG TPA: NAD(P)-dependent alcohol dehydrogenase [Holophagaceae bacterium]|nr:NAD(P)-dependent alcohol dehydrogenase [Holophagaceae bacterium]